ncbi:uncharacterized protein LOC143250447 [Tachypleus tridentatus]|uniref:uncharacterized protein LOC143250447 n=1 Tax=Tachypleus tridentatus TaxID=6853 RepID=UPI003FD2045A
MKYFTKINLPLLVFYNIFCIFLLICVEESVEALTVDKSENKQLGEDGINFNEEGLKNLTTLNSNVSETDELQEITTDLITNSSTTTSQSTTTEIVSTSSSETSTNKTSSSTGSTLLPTATPSSTRRFDAPSFIGGIVLSLGFLAIMYVGFKFYKARTESNYHTL